MSAKLYPLLINEDGTEPGPTTPKEKASWDAGQIAREQNPNPKDERCRRIFAASRRQANEIARERRFVRDNGHKF